MGQAIKLFYKPTNRIWYNLINWIVSVKKSPTNDICYIKCVLREFKSHNVVKPTLLSAKDLTILSDQLAPVLWDHTIHHSAVKTGNGKYQSCCLFPSVFAIISTNINKVNCSTPFGCEKTKNRYRR